MWKSRKASAFDFHRAFVHFQAPSICHRHELAPEISQGLELAPQFNSRKTSSQKTVDRKRDAAQRFAPDQGRLAQFDPSVPPPCLQKTPPARRGTLPQPSTRGAPVSNAGVTPSPSRSGRKGSTLLPAGEASSGRKRMNAPSPPSDPSYSSPFPTPRPKRSTAAPLSRRQDRHYHVRASALQT